MILRGSAVLLLALGLIAVLLVGVLLSPAGTRLLVSWAEGLLDGALVVRNPTGSILGSLCAEDVRFQQPGVEIRVEEVCVAANLWASLDFVRISLQSVEARAVSIVTTPGPEAEPSDEPFSLPLAIDVESLQLGRLAVAGVEIEDLDSSLTLGNADLSSGSSFRFEGERVQLSTRGPWRALRIDLNALGAKARGEVDLHDPDLAYELTVAADEFSLGRFIDRETLLRAVRLTARGNLEGYQAEADVAVLDPSAGGHLLASVTGDWTGLSLDALRLENVSVTDFPLQVGRASTGGRIGWDDGFIAEFRDVAAAGTAAGRSFTLAAPLLGIDAEALQIDDARIRTDEAGGEGWLQVAGRYAFAGVMDLEIEGEGIPLQVADERLDGFGSTRLRLSGDAARPAIAGSVLLEDARFEAQHLERLSAEIEGYLDEAEVAVRLGHVDADVDATLAYRLEETGADVSLRTLAVAMRALPVNASLIEETRLAISADAFRMPQTCFTVMSAETRLDSAELCAAVDYPAGGLTLALAPWPLPAIDVPSSEVRFDGSLQASLSLSSFEPLVGQGEIELKNLIAHHESAQPLVLGDVEMQAQITDRQIAATLLTPEAGTQELVLTGRLSAALASPLEQTPLAGDLYMELDGLWAAQSLLPMDVAFELDQMRGTMGVQANVSGTVAEPLVNGALVLKDVGWRVLATNTSFSDFGGEARLTDSRGLTFEAGGQAGAGRLSLSGEISGLDTDAPRLTSNVVIDGARVIDLPEYSAVMNGQLALGMGAEDLSVNGLLEFPQADILIESLPETAATVSADEVMVGEEAPIMQQIRTTDVTLTLGDDVRLEAFGLKARLVGNLRLEEAPGRLQSVTGIISLRDAEFDAYGQVLQVERGQLTFTGDIENPTVDVEAMKIVNYENRDYRISLLISGTAQELTTTIRSQPALPEDDALALLITGRTFSQISSQERSNVNGAAISMGILSATGVTQNVATRLNLEEIIVDQDAEGNMEVGAALRLNRNLYLRYTYGAFSRLGGVLLRYRLSNRISLQAKTGDAHSIEVRYGVDN